MFECKAFRALSIDAINWHIQTRLEIPRPRWGSLDNVAFSKRFIRYGVWSRREGMSRLPLHSSLDAGLIQAGADEFLTVFKQLDVKPPFALSDHIELWLLDKEHRQPLALLASALDRTRRTAQRSVVWLPTLLRDRANPQWEAPDTLTIKRLDRISAFVNGIAGNPSCAQWFERDGLGGGIGFDGIHLPSDLKNRHLPASSFPVLPIRDRWGESCERQLVNEFHAWQAPFLLMLPQLADETRMQLELQAVQRPMAVHACYRLYPKIIHQALINKALVAAELRKATAE